MTQVSSQQPNGNCVNTNRNNYPTVNLSNQPPTLANDAPADLLVESLAAYRLGCTRPNGKIKINGEEYAKFVTKNGKHACFISLSNSKHQYLVRSYENFQNSFKGKPVSEEQYARIALLASSNGYRHFEKIITATIGSERHSYGIFKTKSGEAMKILVD
ncbi:hypothetical protein [Noviherbaspirillum humi]|uniref:hypothetical protein n=1 Tax=Noviherbaspirillum humi TaxID=1688639 RepID=UPI0011602E61|nr:hypothetical protein [Noviherbaspirillum humi]